MKLGPFFLVSLCAFAVCPSAAPLHADAPSVEEKKFAQEAIAFAETQFAAKKDNRPLPQFSVARATADPNLADAEFVQKHYVGLLSRTDPVAGIKGAVVSAAGQEMFGLDRPLSAVLFSSGWQEANERPAVPIRNGAEPGIETELGVLLGKRIDTPIESVEELKEKVTGIVPVIELPAGKHDWPEKPKAVDLVAVNVDSDIYIVGPPHPDLDLDLDALPVVLQKEGEVLNEATGGNARRGQWWNFLHQVNWAVEQGYALEPGNLIITGALGKIARTGAGDYRATFGPLGEIEFLLVDQP